MLQSQRVRGVFGLMGREMHPLDFKYYFLVHLIHQWIFKNHKE